MDPKTLYLIALIRAQILMMAQKAGVPAPHVTTAQILDALSGIQGKSLMQRRKYSAEEKSIVRPKYDVIFEPSNGTDPHASRKNLGSFEYYSDAIHHAKTWITKGPKREFRVHIVASYPDKSFRDAPFRVYHGSGGEGIATENTPDQKKIRAIESLIYLVHDSIPLHKIDRNSPIIPMLRKVENSQSTSGFAPLSDYLEENGMNPEVAREHMGKFI